MKKIILTGATGLVGRPLLEKLKDNYEILAISRKKRKDNNIIWIQDDLANIKEETLSKIKTFKADSFIHLGWESTGNFNSNINYLFLSNSIRLLNSFLESGGEHVTIAGTYAEYANSDTPLTELSKIFGNNKYSDSKIKLHEIIKKMIENSKVNLTWTRFFSVFGKETTPNRLLSYVDQCIKNNSEVIINHSQLIRDYIYNKDVARALLFLTQNQIPGDFNISTGKGITIGDFISSYCKIIYDIENITLLHKETNSPQVVIGNNTKILNTGFKLAYNLNEAILDIKQNN